MWPMPSVPRPRTLVTDILGPRRRRAAGAAAEPDTEVATAIDDAEVRVRAAVPAARVIYLEPDLDRGSG